MCTKFQVDFQKGWTAYMMHVVCPYTIFRPLANSHEYQTEPQQSLKYKPVQVSTINSTKMAQYLHYAM